MNEEELKKIKRLVDEVIYSQTKRDAMRPFARLNLAISSISHKIPVSAALKLQEVAAYAKEASGQPRMKEHWISCVETSWYSFESIVSTKLK
jgi:hypothetical protein